MVAGSRIGSRGDRMAATGAASACVSACAVSAVASATDSPAVSPAVSGAFVASSAGSVTVAALSARVTVLVSAVTIAAVADSAPDFGAEMMVDGVLLWVRVGTGWMPAVAASIPVATIETRMTPSSFSSKVDPKMMTASLSTSRRTRLAASSTSNKVMSSPPVTLISTARAPCMVMSSSSGLLIAASAAWVARLSPDASPVPIMALPISLITARISAKSRLIWPGLIIRSVTPATP